MNNMKKKLVLFASVSIALASCQTTPKEDYSWIKKGLDVASAQLQLSAEEVSGTGMLPRSIRTGYDMDFLCRQLERDSLTFKDSLRAYYMPASIIRAEVIMHRCHGMFDSDVFISIVACCFCYIEQKIKVHHIVDDNREVPCSEIP